MDLVAAPDDDVSKDLRWALEEADIPILLMVLMQLTGDRRWITDPFLPKRDVRLFADESGGLGEDLRATVRAAIVQELSQRSASARLIDGNLYSEMMSTCVGERVSSEYVPLLLEEMGVTPTMPDWHTGPTSERYADTRVLVVGAGLSGLCAAAYLQAEGIHFEIVERNEDVGGTWLENTYPECGVDTPNHFYSYSFRPNLEWTSYFSKQPEMIEYIKNCVDEFGLVDHIQFATTVRELRWDEDAQLWHTSVQRGDGSRDELVSNFVIVAVGQLNQPALPEIEGIQSFKGPLFHTARWRHDVDLEGKRVAIIGTGASSMQIARSTAALASKLTIFQRSPQWVAPNPDYHRRVSDRKLWLLANVPYYAQWYRFVLFWRYGDGLHRSLFVDPDWPHQDRSVSRSNDRHRQFLTDYLVGQLAERLDLVEKTLPTYPPYGKRMLVDNGWFETLKLDNVCLVTDEISRITTDGIDSAGEHVGVDVIIMATGFQSRQLVRPISVVGRKRLDDVWGPDDATAYLGITVPGLPNLFLMHGPNTALAHGGSVIFHAECQARYSTQLVMRMAESGVTSIDCKQAVHDEYVKRVDAAHATMVWTHPGMTNWYRNSKGRVVSASPWRLVDYWKMTREASLDDYEVVKRADGASES